MRWLAALPPPALQMECRDSGDCSWPANTRCLDDGTNEGTKRCQCERGYQQYDGRSDRSGTERDELLCGTRSIALFVARSSLIY